MFAWVVVRGWVPVGGQAEGVVAEGVQDVAAQHAVVPGVDVRGDVPQGVADVQADTRGVGEHVLDEELVVRQRLIRVSEVPDGVGGVEGALLPPGVLPAGLDVAGELRGVTEGGGLAGITHGCSL